MGSKIFEQILAAERGSDTRLHEGRLHAEERLAAAEREEHEVLATARAELDALRKKGIVEAREAAEKELAFLQAEKANERKALAERAEARMDVAVDRIVEALRPRRSATS